MSLCAAIMFHDEATTMPRCLDAISEHVSHVVAMDVGSTDGTAQVLRDFGAEVYERPWVNPQVNMNELVSLARGHADYLLLVGANDRCEWAGELPELTAPLYLALTRHCWPTVDTVAYEFWGERLFRDDIAWSWSGNTAHGDLNPPCFEERQNLPELVVWHDDDDGRRPEKVARYRVALETELAEHPDDPRSVYYLAQSYRDSGLWREANARYRQRAAMAGWEEEAWHALYQAGVCALPYSFEEGSALLLEAWQRRPGRAESLRALADACHFAADRIAYPADDLLFIEPAAYANRGVPA